MAVGAKWLDRMMNNELNPQRSGLLYLMSPAISEAD